PRPSPPFHGGEGVASQFQGSVEMRPACCVARIACRENAPRRVFPAIRNTEYAPRNTFPTLALALSCGAWQSEMNARKVARLDGIGGNVRPRSDLRGAAGHRGGVRSRRAVPAVESFSNRGQDAPVS